MKLWVPALILVCPAIAGDFAIFSSIGFLRNLPQPPAILVHPPDESVAVLAPQFPKDVHALIRAAAQKHGVPAAFVTSIVKAESNFNPNALSPKGAIGLMQLMPETAQQFGADPHVPEQNIDAGTRYLRWLIDKYHRYHNGSTRAIAAYNAGSAMVDRYRGTPPFRETRIYVARVLGFLKEFKSGRM
jgi:soluble lytic murein transglycosylase-like protein